MFHNLTVNLNGKLITLSPFEKCTIQCDGGPLQDATCTENIPPFIFNTNKRLEWATEERIKERYCWQQTDKKVKKKSSQKQWKKYKGKRDWGASLLSKPLSCFWRHYNEEYGYSSLNYPSVYCTEWGKKNYILITNFIKSTNTPTGRHILPDDYGWSTHCKQLAIYGIRHMSNINSGSFKEI